LHQVLPDTNKWDRAAKIRQWVVSVIDKLDGYKVEHYRYVKEGVTLLELALWKAKLGEEEESSAEGRTNSQERRITCGAAVVIKNELPFLQLE